MHFKALHFLPPVPRVEWPTIGVAALVYGGWLGLTAMHASIPLVMLVPAGALLIALHSSLQHEIIHGHPTGIARLDHAIGFPPLALWLPFSIYRRSHLAHHAAPITTDPDSDPESNYHAARKGWAWRAARVEAALLGRLLLGPAIRITRFLIAEGRSALESPAQSARDWIPHLAATALIIAWLDHVALDLANYLLWFVYSGTSVSLLRSFAEHRAHSDPRRRAVIVERGGILGALFLNNHLHAVHHAKPTLAWYRLPRWLAQNGEAFADAPRYRSYAEITRRYLLKPQDDLIHPAYRIGATA